MSGARPAAPGAERDGGRRTHGHVWEETVHNRRTGARERQCGICGAIQCWSPEQNAWSWEVMPWDEFGLRLLDRS